MDQDVTPNRPKRAPSPTLNGESPTLASIKRRKLNDVGAQSRSTPKALNAIASAISGVFGYNRQPAKEVTPSMNPQPVPQASAVRDAAAPAPAPTPAPAHAAAPLPPASAPPRLPPALKKSALRGTIWDDGSSPPPKKKPTPKRKPTPKGPQTTPGKRGAWQQAGNGSPGIGSSPLNGTPSKARSIPLANGSPLKKTLVNGDGESAYDFSDAAPDHAFSSAGKNGTGKRLWGSSAASPTPKKGILTPTKRRGRPPKVVKFESKFGGEVFFEDLPKRGRPKATRKDESDDEDEIRCAICSRAHSKAPNEIILCDNCDFAVHQECYEVPEIPEGDWLCKSCAQEDVLKTPKKAAEEEVPTVVSEVPDIPNLDHHVRCVQRVLLDRATGRRRIRMFGQQEAYDKTRQIVQQTVAAGEGNSMLVIGPRGSGKTTMVENIVSDLVREHRQDFHVVRLNGFVHTDDKLALKEIWRQLGREMDVEDDLVNRTNYADTMASLLALLSHPSEILGTDEGVTSQSIVFVIDEFDMFAAHPRQTLLYNLFDVAQSRKAPIAVLGCTTRLDVVEMLEKRVKSRFSHRYVYLSLPKTLAAFWQVCRQGLIVERGDMEKEGIDQTVEGHEEFRKYWLHKIEGLYKERSFQDLLQYHYYTTKSPSAFFTEWIMPLSSLSATNLDLHPPPVASEATSLAPPDSRMHLLAALSDLDLALLIAAARLDIVAHTDTVNFAMAYDEYGGLVGRQRVQSATSGMLAMGGGARVWGRGVAGIAWERLVSLGLLVPHGAGRTAATALGHGGLEGRMCKVDVALEEIPSAVKLNAIQAKWCREI